MVASHSMRRLNRLLSGPLVSIQNRRAEIANTMPRYAVAASAGISITSHGITS